MIETANNSFGIKIKDYIKLAPGSSCFGIVTSSETAENMCLPVTEKDMNKTDPNNLLLSDTFEPVFSFVFFEVR